jgi:hypothetical protein
MYNYHSVNVLSIKIPPYRCTPIYYTLRRRIPEFTKGLKGKEHIRYEGI